MLFIGLYVFFVLLCGRLTADVLISGIFVAAAVHFAACRFFAYSVKKDVLSFALVFLDRKSVV